MGTTRSERELAALWAKKRTVDGRQEWLPLLAHLNDTGQMSTQLFNLWLSDGTKRVMIGDASEADTLTLVKFLGFIHDVGKCSAGFQTQPSFDGNQDLDHELIERLIGAGFSGLDPRLLSSRRASPHALAGEAILERMGLSPAIGAIIGGHHGQPLANPPQFDIAEHTSNYWQDDRNVAVQKRWQDSQAAIVARALEFAGLDAISQLPGITQVQAVLFEGLLIMADWLASSETMPGAQPLPLFPLIPIDQGLADIDLVARYQNAWRTWWHGSSWEPLPVSLASDPYVARWHFNARPVQRRMTEAIAQSVDPGITIIEAPMGMGKTETALLAAEQLAFKTGRNGVFFGLPTQATTNAMFTRVLEWLKELPGSEDSAKSVELMHSKARFNRTWRAIPLAENVEDSRGTVTVNQWFAGKKTILNAFDVGTIDHLLQMGLKQKHLMLRHLGFANKIVIGDEIHAADVYMDRYLVKALQWLGAYHVPVVLLSATLPKVTRTMLLEAYFKGKYGGSLDRKADLSQVPDDWRETEAYPLLTLLDGPQLREISDFPDGATDGTRTIAVKRMGADKQALLDSVLAAIADGGVAGVIVNTVQAAQELAALVPESIPTIVLHSAFLAPDRAAIEEQLQTLIGKNGNRPDRLLVIGTQVLEQSLDIDFDLMVTEIAPLDLVLQRVGRLHRHARPRGLAKPTLVVSGFGPDGDYGPSEKIYARYLLMKSDYYLPDTIVLPTDISPLVQKVYDFKHDPNLNGLAEAKRDFEQQQATQVAKAEVFQIKPPTRKPGRTLHNWLARRDPFADRDEQRANAAVRDIDETLEVILLKQTHDGVALMDGRPITACTDAEIAEELVRLPRVFSMLGHKVVIDQTIAALERQTSRNYPDWQRSVWLKGALALTLNQNGEAELLGWRVTYSTHTGLSYRKEDANDTAI